MAGTPTHTDMLMKLFSSLEGSISQQITAIKEDIREDGKRRDNHAATLDTTYKAEFVSLKQILLDVQKMIVTLPSREDYNRIDQRLSKVENTQTAKLPVFDDIQTRLRSTEAHVATLLNDRTSAQGAWWLAVKVGGLLTAIFAVGTWVYENFIK